MIITEKVKTDTPTKMNIINGMVIMDINRLKIDLLNFVMRKNFRIKELEKTLMAKDSRISDLKKWINV